MRRRPILLSFNFEMKKIFLLIFLLFFLILFQTSFLNFLKVTPNFILITILILAIFEKNRTFGLLSAFLGGIFLDIFSGQSLGVATLSLVLVYFLSVSLLKLFFKVNFFEVTFIIILGAIFYNFLLPSFNYLSELILGTKGTFQLGFNYLTFIEIILNLILGLIVFYLLKHYGVFRSPTIKRFK